MNNLNEIVQQHLSNGFTIVQARYKAAQEVILSKIEQSTYVDKILLKGGIVMYNMTKEQRRTTSDLDLAHRTGILGCSTAEMKMSLGC